MSNTNELLNRINSSYAKLSKGQKRLSAYITDNYDKAAFWTAKSWEKRWASASPPWSALPSGLGYKGYPEFQKALGELVRTKLNTAQRVEAACGRMPESQVLSSVLREDMEKIQTTLDTIDETAFEAAVDTILHARRVYVIGIRSCEPLAAFLTFYLNLVIDDVRCIRTNSASEIFEQMLRINQEDVLIGISFPRYSMRTLKALEYANDRNAKVITITDSIHSPMNLYSSCNLIAAQ